LRAVSRALADHRVVDLPTRDGAEQRRDDRARRRAEREHRAAGSESCIRARSRARRRIRRERRAARQRIGAQELPRLLMAVARALKIGLPLTRRRVRPAVTWPVALLLLVACVFLTIGSLTSAIFAEQTVAGLAQGGVYASLAVALVLIYRATE